MAAQEMGDAAIHIKGENEAKEGGKKRRGSRLYTPPNKKPMEQPRIDYRSLQKTIGDRLLSSETVLPRPAQVSDEFFTLLDFQQKAFHFMTKLERKPLKDPLSALRGGCLCSPTGTGKTFMMTQLCAANLLERDNPLIASLLPPNIENYCPINLIICPSVISSHWQREIQKALPHAEFFEFNPKKSPALSYVEYRKWWFGQLLQRAANTFAIMSWESLSEELDHSHEKRSTRKTTGETAIGLPQYHFGRIVFDEVQYAGSRSNKRFQVAMKLSSVFRWFQSATPVSRRPLEELQKVVQFLCPSVSASWWLRNIETPARAYLFGPLVDLLSQFMWTTTREQVKVELPKLYSRDFPIQLTPLEWEYYNDTDVSLPSKKAFLSAPSMSKLTLTLYVLNSRSASIEKFELDYVSRLYELAKRELTVARIKESHELLEKSLERCQQTSLGNFNENSKVWLKHALLEWRERTARICGAILLFRDTSPLLENTALFSKQRIRAIKYENEQAFLIENSDCVQTLQMIEIEAALVRNKDEIFDRSDEEQKRTASAQMQDAGDKQQAQAVWPLWIEYKTLRTLNQEALDQLEANRMAKKSLVTKEIDPAISEQYENLHAALDAIDERSLSLTLKQKFLKVLEHQKVRFRAKRPSKMNMDRFDHYLTKLKHKNGLKSEEVNIDTLNIWKDMDTDLGFNRWVKTVGLTPENAEQKKSHAIEEWNRYTNMAYCAHCIHSVIWNDQRSAPDSLKAMERAFDEAQREFNEILIKKPVLISGAQKEDIPSDLAKLNSQMHEFDQLISQVLDDECKCASCDFYFDRERIPMRRKGCSHVICKTCEDSRLAICPRCPINARCLQNTLTEDPNFYQCANCKKNTSLFKQWACNGGICKTCDKARNLKCSVCNLQATATILEDFKPSGTQQCDFSLRRNGSKLTQILDLTYSKMEDPGLLADETREDIAFRKVLVFDSDPNFLIRLDALLQKKKQTSHFVFDVFKVSNKSVDSAQEVGEFIDSHNSSVLLLNIVGTAGMHLVAADTVIICSPPDDPTHSHQAQSRAHRVGQKRPVLVYNCYCKRTFEEQTHNMLIKYSDDFDESDGDESNNEQKNETPEYKEYGYQGPPPLSPNRILLPTDNAVSRSNSPMQQSRSSAASENEPISSILDDDLEVYKNILEAEGFLKLDHMRLITDQNLLAIGITSMGHRHRILINLKKRLGIQ